MKLWNAYLVTFECGAVSRVVGSIESRREPVARLQSLKKEYAKRFPGKWDLFARPAENYPWNRPQES